MILNQECPPRFHHQWRENRHVRNHRDRPAQGVARRLRDRQQRVELAELKVRTGLRQLGELLAWAAPFGQRTWAIESAGGLGYLLAQQLIAQGEHVVDVPATLSSRVRVLGSGRSNKNDANDASAVAIAALRSRLLADVLAEDHVSVLRLLAKAQLDASRARSRACCRLHALVRELVPGGIRKQIVVAQADQVLAKIEPVNATQRQRLELAHETVDEISLLDAKLTRGHASPKPCPRPGPR
jgi:transposase